MKNKKIIITIILAIFLFLGLGYAYLNTTLLINGVTDVDRNTWNVYWTNPQVTFGSVSGAQVTTPPTIDTNKTTVSFQVRLSKPGDYYEFTIDAKNDGTIDAMIDDVSLTLNGNSITSLPSYLSYYMVYYDWQEIEEKQLLATGDTVRYKIRIKYRDDYGLDIDDLPTTPQSLSISFNIDYVQADSSAVPLKSYLFSVSDTPLNLNQQIPSNAELYDTPEEAIATVKHSTFVRVQVENNIVKNIGLGFVANDRIYIIDRAESMDDLDAIKNRLNNIFGNYACDNSIICENGEMTFHIYYDDYNDEIYYPMEVFHSSFSTYEILGGCGYLDYDHEAYCMETFN